MAEKESTKKAGKPPPGSEDPPVGKERAKDHDEPTPEEWFAGIGAGMKGISRKLLDHVPPEIREKVVKKARSHGPGAAAAAVNAAALKTRSLKAKLALKTLAGLLRLLDSKDSVKDDLPK